MSLKEGIAVALFGLYVLFAPQTNAASGQGVAEAARAEECKNILRDELHIGYALGHGVPVDALRVQAMQYRKELGEERYAHVLVLIDQANIANQQGKLNQWFAAYWQACLNK